MTTGNRRPLIAGNWKMFKTCSEAVETVSRLMELARGADTVDIMVAPPFTSLHPVSEVAEKGNIAVGAQNIFWEKDGAYTGEISADMLRSCGVTHVLIGHSERRQYFGETDETVNRRVGAAIAAELIPVLCVGETEEQREEGNTFSVLDKQIKKGLEGLSASELVNLVVAYEPVWAIGTGKTATPSMVQEVHGFLRDLIEKTFDSDLSSAVRILYGGSVKPDNIGELMALADVDGALVGGASLDPETFSRIIHF